MATAETAAAVTENFNSAKHSEEAWAAGLLMPSPVGEETIYMTELREAHLRYLLAIYELGRNDPDVGRLTVHFLVVYHSAIALQILS